MKIWTGHCISCNQALLMYNISDLYPLQFLRYRNSNWRTGMTKHFNYIPVGVCCCSQTCTSVVKMLVIRLVKFDGHIYHKYPVICKSISHLQWECIVVVYTQSTLFTYILTGHCTSGHQTLFVCKISDLYLLRFLRYWDSV